MITALIMIFLFLCVYTALRITLKVIGKAFSVALQGPKTIKKQTSNPWK